MLFCLRGRTRKLKFDFYLYYTHLIPTLFVI
jgi:hypothetical protein